MHVSAEPHASDDTPHHATSYYPPALSQAPYRCGRWSGYSQALVGVGLESFFVHRLPACPPMLAVNRHQINGRILKTSMV